MQNDVFVRLHRSLPRAGSLYSFVLSAVVIAVCALLKVSMDIWVGMPVPPYITFYPAVVICSLLGGPVVGLASGAVTLFLAWYFWIAPAFSFAMLDRLGVATVATYAVTLPIIALAVGAARQYLDRQAASAAELEAVARESVHRTKNLIAIVQALTTKVAREVSTVDEFKRILGDRFHALGLAQDLLLRREWQDADLEELLHTALAPFLRNPALTVQKGSHVLVPARHVRGLCMALYELCTNAMKYGGLAYGRGSVTLTWHTVDNDCVLKWREEVRARDSVLQNQPGLGTLLIRMALSNDTGTTVQYEIGSTSVLAAFRWPDAGIAERPQNSNVPSVIAEPLKGIADNRRVAATASAAGL